MSGKCPIWCHGPISSPEACYYLCAGVGFVAILMCYDDGYSSSRLWTDGSGQEGRGVKWIHRPVCLHAVEGWLVPGFCSSGFDWGHVSVFSCSFFISVTLWVYCSNPKGTKKIGVRKEKWCKPALHEHQKPSSYLFFLIYYISLLVLIYGLWNFCVCVCILGFFFNPSSVGIHSSNCPFYYLFSFFFLPFS